MTCDPRIVTGKTLLPDDFSRASRPATRLEHESIDRHTRQAKMVPYSRLTLDILSFVLIKHLQVFILGVNFPERNLLKVSTPSSITPAPILAFGNTKLIGN